MALFEHLLELLSAIRASRKGLLGVSWEPSWVGVGACRRHVVSYLKPCWAILVDLGGRLGLSEALLEPLQYSTEAMRQP